MSDPEDLFCVILHATPVDLSAQETFPMESSARESLSNPLGGLPPNGGKDFPQASSGDGSLTEATHESYPVRRNDGTASGLSCSLAPNNLPRPRQSRTVLFSGYVTYGQVSEHIQQSGPGRQLGDFFGSLLGGTPSARERIHMIGPGGVGEAEVAVQKLREVVMGGAVAAERAAGSSVHERGAFRSILSSMASLLRNDTEGGKDGKRPEGTSGHERLQCSLMSLWLPVDKLARSVLDSMG